MDTLHYVICLCTLPGSNAAATLCLRNQNRIVKLEFRLRYLELFSKPSSEVEDKLSFSQIAALRFASDDEFAALLEKTIQRNLEAGEIKRLIKNWKADHMRV